MDFHTFPQVARQVYFLLISMFNMARVYGSIVTTGTYKRFLHKYINRKLYMYSYDTENSTTSPIHDLDECRECYNKFFTNIKFIVSKVV